MRTLILIHRWLGVGFCLFFAMWFASGIVMHFVPFPVLTEAERVAGLAPLKLTVPVQSPAAAVHAAMLATARTGELSDAAIAAGVTRVRLIARPDGAVYVVHTPAALHAGLHAVYADTLERAGVANPAAALRMAMAHAQHRGLPGEAATFAETALHDQWSVPNGLDAHRPLHRIALNDAAGTELYVSSVTGEVVRDTTRHERVWNYAGSVVHWIYPTVLRRDQRAWIITVWVLSLAALIAAISGTVLGVLRTRIAHGRPASPYRGWIGWHHWLGLGTAVFVLTWIFSGWLSMDNGLLFSTGRPDRVDAGNLSGTPQWPTEAPRAFPGEAPRVMRGSGPLEMEWFGFDGHTMRRERFDLTSQLLAPATSISAASLRVLGADEAARAARHVMPGCGPAEVIAPGDSHPATSSLPGAPVYRVVCGSTWLHIDSANGMLLQKLDASRRAYRWLYKGLHTFDFPALTAHPALRTWLIVLLSIAGLASSITAIVIGWRRLRNIAGKPLPPRVSGHRPSHTNANRRRSLSHAG